MSLYSPMNDPKYQAAELSYGENLAEDVIVAADVRRADRLPPGQTRTRKWPVLHASVVPNVTTDSWAFTVQGLVDRPLTLSYAQFRNLPRVRVFADFHCVTNWSRLGNLWEGVSLPALLAEAGIQREAQFAVIGGFDDGWTTNLPLAELLAHEVVLADTHDGRPLDADHGGPVRLIVPRLFAWKSAKWVSRIELTRENRPGYWEQAGYHNLGDPWIGQRYRDDSDWIASAQVADSDHR